MDWKKIISEIQAAGFTQNQIAKAAGCAQSSLSDLYNGKTTEPLYRIGERIVAMHKLHCQKKAA